MDELDLSSYPDAIALFDVPLAVVVGASSANRQPHFARGQGIRRGQGANEIVVLVPDAVADPILSDVQENPHLAVTIASIADFETRQFVGTYAGAEPADESDLDLCDTMLERSGQVLGAFYGDESAAHWKRTVTRPARAICLRVTSVYDQTPGSRAGKKLS